MVLALRGATTASRGAANPRHILFYGGIGMKDFKLLLLERKTWREKRFGRPRGLKPARQRTAREIRRLSEGFYRQILLGQ